MDHVARLLSFILHDPGFDNRLRNISQRGGGRKQRGPVRAETASRGKDRSLSYSRRSRLRPVRSANVDSRHSIARAERPQSAPGLRSVYRLAPECGIMIPHSCLSNADHISGRFRDGQRLEVTRQRRHYSGCVVGCRQLRAGRRCAPARIPRRALPGFRTAPVGSFFVCPVCRR
jgi:hypothetical protein